MQTKHDCDTLACCMTPRPPPRFQGALTFSSKWSPTQIRANDPVAAAVISNTNNVATSFWWSHHTFTHENLDNATSFDARAQIELNIAMAVGAFIGARPAASLRAACGSVIRPLAAPALQLPLANKSKRRHPSTSFRPRNYWGCPLAEPSPPSAW
jgi:hypothetical protein